MNENEMVVLESREMSVLHDTESMVANATKAAMSLKRIIAQKDKPVKFNGEQYLEYEDWQTAGQFYGYSVKTGSAAAVEVDGVKGAKASAELFDKEGRLIGGAESFCMRDEQNWARKPWFQLASMAQTRAGAKALRNRLAWFVVLAGLKPTPAEEMSEETKHEQQSPAIAKVNTENISADNIVSDILDKLVALHQGDQDLVEKHLKFITKWTDKEGVEKWLKISDLEGVAQRKPEWIERIHKKVVADFKRAQQ